MTTSSTSARQTWIDAVKGFTIVLVVFHHVFGGVSSSLSPPEWFLRLYELSQPIRMPLFFSVAGFFAIRSLKEGWGEFIDKKVLYFLYFYVLWSLIIIGVRSSLGAFTNNPVAWTDALYIFVRPTFTIWFLYALLISFVLAKLTVTVPRLWQLLVALAVAVLAGLFGDGEWFAVKVLKRYPFFVFGVHYSREIRTWVQAASVPRLVVLGSGYVAVLGVIYVQGIGLGALLYYLLAFWSIGLFCSLIFLAVKFRPVERVLGYVGSRSLYIYLMHFVPAAGVRIVGVKLGMGDHPLLLAVLGTLIAVSLCLAVHRVMARYWPDSFLFKRPTAISAPIQGMRVGDRSR
ncbi:MAG: acyltransferase family protein [Rhodocyclaceae bacterium]